MRNKLLIVVGIVLGGLAVGGGIRAVSNRGVARPEVARTGAAFPKPEAYDESAMLSDRQLRAAQNTIERAPTDPLGYNLLCAAYLKKARETGDFSFNARAEAALNRSLELSPADDNYDALGLKATLLLAYHRFDEALEVARRAQRSRPQDPHNYGAITDALVELGDYRGAFEAAQQMMDLRPGALSYARVSYLRELQGDVRGAIEVMRAAAEAAGDPETRAWCRVHLGDLLINTNDLASAEREFERALAELPDYHLALAGLARARVSSGDMEAAVRFYERARQRVPLPDTAIALGDLHLKLGHLDEAKKLYHLAESGERAGGNTYSRQLALFYADHDMKLDDALQIMRRERAARSDIYTCDALAWVLYKKGDLAAAKTAIGEASQLGTRDARIEYHAGMIEHALGHHREAAKHLQLALKINPSFDVLQADVARQTLRTLLK
ncbi:MAG TPA: tetratricopeptide repeat protein [Pyrinomonadaceae bacterium]